MLGTRVDWRRLTVLIVISAVMSIITPTVNSTAGIDFASPGEGK